jgi:hypothetical protein
MFMDYTRMTQPGEYHGWVEAGGRRVDMSGGRGIRDRSWGVRPIGASDPQPMEPPLLNQFFWIWAPINYPDGFSLYHLNADQDGAAWNTAGVIGVLGDGPVEHFVQAQCDLRILSGTRHAAGAQLRYTHPNGSETVVELQVEKQFYMAGLGYLHPEWGHGMNKGPLAQSYDTIHLDSVSTYLPPYIHVEAIVRAARRTPDGRTVEGIGVLEQLILGPSRQYGLRDLLDPRA